VAKHLLAGILVTAAAVLIVGAHCRIVVAGDAGDLESSNESDGLVRPWRIAHEVAEMIGGRHPALAAHMLQHGLEGRKVGMNV
jgi:hypothetical protein